MKKRGRETSNAVTFDGPDSLVSGPRGEKLLKFTTFNLIKLIELINLLHSFGSFDTLLLYWIKI